MWKNIFKSSQENPTGDVPEDIRTQGSACSSGRMALGLGQINDWWNKKESP